MNWQRHKTLEVIEGDVIRAYLNKDFFNSILKKVHIDQEKTHELGIRINKEYEERHGHWGGLEPNPFAVDDFTSVFYNYMWNRFTIDMRFINESYYNTEIDLIVTKVTDKYIHFSVAGNIPHQIRKYLECHRIPKGKMFQDYFIMGTAPFGSNKVEKTPEKEVTFIIGDKQYTNVDDIPEEELRNIECIKTVEYLTMKEIKKRFGKV